MFVAAKTRARLNSHSTSTESSSVEVEHVPSVSGASSCMRSAPTSIPNAKGVMTESGVATRSAIG